MKRYRQEIEIGNNIDGIFKLPCVVGCHKTCKGLHYFTVRCVNADFADICDKLCEDYDGCWWLERKKK